MFYANHFGIPSQNSNVHQRQQSCNSTQPHVKSWKYCLKNNVIEIT